MSLSGAAALAFACGMTSIRAAPVALPLSIRKSPHGAREHSPLEYLYSVEVQVDGHQTFDVLIDTGSPIFAVAASANLDSKFYSGSCDGFDASLTYGGGMGFIGKACDGVEVKMGGMSAGMPTFVGINHSITRPASQGAKRYGAFNLTGPVNQGIVGLSYPNHARYLDSKFFTAFELFGFGCADCSSSEMCESVCSRQPGALNSERFTPLVNSVFESLSLPPIFSMQCCGTHGDLSEDSGKLVLGGVDHSLYAGDLQYTPIIFEAFYYINVTRVGTSASEMVSFQTGPLLTPETTPPLPEPLTTDVLNYYLLQQQRAFYADSGNSFLGLGSGEVWESVKTSINQAAATAGLGPVLVGLRSDDMPSCVTADLLGHFPDIIIELQGEVTLQIPPVRYLQPQRDHPECLWPFVTDSFTVLGMPVLETYFTVYDQAGKRLGFAPVAGCDQPPATTVSII